MMEAETRPVLFRTVTEAAAELLGFEYNTVRRYDSEHVQLVPVAVSPALRDKSGNREVYDRTDTVQWQAIREDEIRVFQTVSEIDDEVERSGEGSMIVVPLTGFGVLSMGSPEPRGIDEDDVQLAGVFGANIETAIKRIEQLEMLNERERRLSQQTQQIMVMNRALRHNIRNELNLLLGHQTALRETVTEEDSSHVEQSLEIIQEIDDLAKRARTIQETLSEEHAVKRIDIVDVTDTQLDRVRDSPSVVSIATEFPASAPVMAIEPIRLGIREAVENAVDHNDQSRPRIHASIERFESGGHTGYRLTIEDDGPGIPRQERQILSDGTEHKLRHSSGLGLWCLKWLLDRSGGSLEFGESRFETGTAVRLCFREAGTERNAFA